MKKFDLFAVPSLCIFLLAACSNSEAAIQPTSSDIKEPALEEKKLEMLTGYVSAIDGNKMLVYTASIGLIWFSDIPKSIEVGDHVQVEAGIVAHSFPGQANGATATVLPQKETTQATFTEKQAIQQALKQLIPEKNPPEGGLYIAPYVTSTSYKEKTDTWEIRIRNSEDKEIRIQIKP